MPAHDLEDRDGIADALVVAADHVARRQDERAKDLLSRIQAAVDDLDDDDGR